MDTFELLADPSRRLVLDALIGGERPAGDMVAALPHLSQPAVSRHLKVLREGGLVRVRVDGQRRLYAIEPAGLAEVDAWLSKYRAFWTNRLDQLEGHLTASTTSRRTTKGTS